MRKLLVGATALMGASLLSAMATSAVAMPIKSRIERRTPVLSASMVAQFEMGIADNEANVGSPNTRDGGIVNGRYAEVFFKGEMTTDSGLVYGARIHLATGTAVTTNEFPGREYIYLQGNWGSINMGNWIGADSLLNLCPVCNTYYGYGGINAPFKSYAIDPGDTLGGPGFRDDGVNANWFNFGPKVTYITPIIRGFQGAVSYMPESRAAPPNGPFVNNDGTFEDVILLGAQYSGDIGNVSVSFSVVGAFGNGDNTTTSLGTIGTNPSNSVDNTGIGTIEFGAIVQYAGFSLGGNYWDDGTTGALKNRDYGFESTGWTVDAGYRFGPLAIELQYVRTHRAGSSRLIGATQANLLTTTGSFGPLVGAPTLVEGANASNTVEEFDFTGIAASLGYDIAPGLKWYGEVVRFDYDHKAAAVLAAASVPKGDNTGVALISGFILGF